VSNATQVGLTWI